MLKNCFQFSAKSSTCKGIEMQTIKKGDLKLTFQLQQTGAKITLENTRTKKVLFQNFSAIGSGKIDLEKLLDSLSKLYK